MALISRLPPLRLAGRAGRLAGDRRRAGRRRSRENGGTIETGRPVRALDELPAADAVVLDLAPGARRRDRRRAAAGARRPRLPPLPARPGRVQGRPRGRGRGALDGRGLPAGPGPSTRSAPSRRSSPPSATSTAAGCRSGPFVLVGQQYLADPGRSRRRRPPGLGLRPRAQRLRRRRDRGGARPDRALRARPARADRRRATSARRPSSRPTTPTTSAATSSPARTRRCRSLIRPRLALDPYATGDPRRLHLLGGDAARRRRPRDVRLQRRPLSASRSRRRAPRRAGGRRARSPARAGCRSRAPGRAGRRR